MRVAWVVPRYGPEVGGGAEEHCRWTVDLLREDIESTVLTSCALDYRTWADHYPPGESVVGGVRTLRFPVPRPRDPLEFERLSERVFNRPPDGRAVSRWLRAQGPEVPGLLEHLRRDSASYDAVCFIPYLYSTTTDGIALVADRALLWPLAHDEPPLRLAPYERVFSAPRVLVFNTPEERELVEHRFGADERARFTIGIALDPPPPSDATRFRERYGVTGPYLLCVGRIEPAKGTDVAIERFVELRQRLPRLSLVLVGRPHMDLPSVPGLVVTGYVDEQTKHDALAGASVVLLPSPYESLSIVAREAWAHARPTLANAAAEPLRGQSARSNGGLWYWTPAEFHAALGLLLEHPALAETLGLQGRRWVRAAPGRDEIRAQWMAALHSATPS